MKKQITASAMMAVLLLSMVSTVSSTPLGSTADGATRISGIAYWPQPGDCEDAAGDGSDYALSLIGDLNGCLYTFVESFRCTPGGAYYESGTETFVGTYTGQAGNFRTNYVFTAVYKDCRTLDIEIAGRCQHPIIAGSGTGVFDGLIGRVDMLDDVQAGNFPYRGHLRPMRDNLTREAMIDLSKDKLSFEEIILSPELGSLQRC